MKNYMRHSKTYELFEVHGKTPTNNTKILLTKQCTYTTVKMYLFTHLHHKPGLSYSTIHTFISSFFYGFYVHMLNITGLATVYKTQKHLYILSVIKYLINALKTSLRYFNCTQQFSRYCNPEVASERICKFFLSTAAH